MDSLLVIDNSSMSAMSNTLALICAFSFPFPFLSAFSSLTHLTFLGTFVPCPYLDVFLQANDSVCCGYFSHILHIFGQCWRQMLAQVVLLVLLASHKWGWGVESEFLPE